MPTPHQCLNCGVSLVPKMNWWMSDVRQHRSICGKCHYALNRKWPVRNPERNRKYKREYTRMHYVERSDGRLIRVNKKPFLGVCELCDAKYDMNMVYHHWNDENPDDGIWICRRCHMFVHACIRHPRLLEKLRVALRTHQIATLEITLS